MEFHIVIDRHERDKLRDINSGDLRILGKSVSTGNNDVFLRVDGTEEDFTYFRILLGNDKVWAR
jgi:hypothetical protein